MLTTSLSSQTLPTGTLRRVHHIALNVRDMQASRYFYGTLLGLHELTRTEVPVTLKDLVTQGKVANFVTPDGTVLDLFGEPDLAPPHPDPRQQFTRANHLALILPPRILIRRWKSCVKTRSRSIMGQSAIQRDRAFTSMIQTDF